MKSRKIPLLSYVIFFVICWDVGNGTENEREKRLLNYKYNAGVEGLNFERIISLWNRSASALEEPPMSQRWSMPGDRRDIPASFKISTTTTTTTTTSKPKATSNEKSRDEKISESESFPDRFKRCIGQQQKKLAEGALGGQNILVKCFKTELVSKLHGLLAESDSSIKLFNGYLEFEKIGKKRETDTEERAPSRKRYSARVNSEAKASSDSYVRVPARQTGPVRNGPGDYYENYQKMLKELVARKTGNDRLKRELPQEKEENGETLKETAKLFENGRKLISEINNNLENEEEEVESLTRTIMDPELVSALNTFTRNYAVKLNFYPGISARMKRNQNNGVTFDLELDELSGDDDDDDDDDDDQEEVDDGAGRGDKKKKKKKIKISKKTLKKLFPYLLIPFMIQAALLPFVLKFLLFVAIKALIAGKLALVLVAFNVLKNAGHKDHDDEYAERMAVEHYGYGNGEEYGAWINRRNFVIPERQLARKIDNDPYRAHLPSNS